MVVFVSRALVAAALVLAGPALGQAVPPPAAPASPPPSAEPDIVVTGEMDREQQVRNFVAALTPSGGQLSRFEDAICPAAFGLSGAPRDAVVQRMRAVSAAVGLRLATVPCTPNVLLMVTRDKRVLIETLARTHPNFFSDEDVRPSRLAREPGPAAAWDARVMLNADGRPVSYEDGLPVNRTSHGASHITAAGRTALLAAVVVVESGALEGLSTTQLADYALMRALGRTDPHRLTAASPPSILTALEAPMDAAVAPSLTRWDLGFLRGLYAAPANLRVSAHRGAIRQHVSSEVEQSGASEH